MAKRSYVTYAPDGGVRRLKGEPAAKGCDVVYRLNRIGEELVCPDALSAPNAVRSAGLSAYTSVEARPHSASSVELDGPPVLVMVRGRDAREVISAVASSGMAPFAPFTADHGNQSHLRFAKGTVCIGDRYSSKLFSNAHAVLTAAEACGATAVFLCDEAIALASVDLFLFRAAQRGLKVYAPLDGRHPLLGWTECSTEKTYDQPESWRACPHCGLSFEEVRIASSHYTCPHCGGPMRMTSQQRIDDLLDMGSFEEWFCGVEQTDPLDFPGYRDKLAAQRAKTGLEEAVRCGVGSIAGIRAALAVMDSTFFMGSMGSVVGEKVARTFDRATEEGLPVIVFCASGGARMQEGLVSLMQMAKVSCAVERHSRARLLYISVVTDPTTGGVTASFALQGDIVVAEPRALIGFAGKRVIQDTIRQELPEGFQTAEFALEHGLIDAVVPRERMRSSLAHLLAVHAASCLDASAAPGAVDGSGARCTKAIVSYEGVCQALESGQGTFNYVTYGRIPVVVDAADLTVRSVIGSIAGLVGRGVGAVRFAASPVTAWARARAERERHAPERVALPREKAAAADANAAWESVQLARNVNRPTAMRYIERIFDGFQELHGDRMFGDDGAIVGGVAWLAGCPVTVIAQEKGADVRERVARNFGCPQPEGYRKSLRLMRQAEKFGRPIVCLVDTQGAFCGAEAEMRGQGNAIAENLVAMAGLKVPVVSVLIGEGGSGGALALAVSNRVAMQKHAVYSVLSPEGFASILWKDRTRAPEAAAVMRMSADEVARMGIVERVLSEGEGPAHLDPDRAAAEVRSFLIEQIEELSVLTPDELIEQRHRRFAAF